MVNKLKTERLILILLLLISLTMHLIYGLEGMRQVETYEHLINKQAAQLKDKELQIQIQNMLLDMQDDIIQNHIIEETAIEPEYIGEFEISYYTAGPESTGKHPGHPEYGITASGTTVKEGQTIAADWNLLPPGTTVYIEGIGERVVEDTGGLIKGNAIDVYVPDVETALQSGRHMADVYMLEDSGGK